MKESQIQRAICQFLQYLENQGKLYFFRSGSGAIETNRGTWFKSGKPGCPDVSVCLAGRFVGLEVKTASGKQSNNQKAAQKSIEKAGGEYYIVRSVQDVENIINEILNRDTTPDCWFDEYYCGEKIETV